MPLPRERVVTIDPGDPAKELIYPLKPAGLRMMEVVIGYRPTYDEAIEWWQRGMYAGDMTRVILPLFYEDGRLSISEEAVRRWWAEVQRERSSPSAGASPSTLDKAASLSGPSFPSEGSGVPDGS